MTRTLNRADIEDMIQGATILGTGGGGDPRKGLKLLEEDMKAGREISLVDPEELSDESIIVCSYLTGSIAPATENNENTLEKGLTTKKSLCSIATEALAEYIQKEISAIIPVEIGGQNTPEAMHVAAEMGLPTVDGDLVGRAVPNDEQTSYSILGLPMTPITVADNSGDVVIIPRVASDVHAERLIRAIAVATGGFVGTADHPLSGKVVKKSIVLNTVTHCINIGKAIRRARERGEDPLPKLLQITDGYLLLQGEVNEFNWEDRGGFMYGTTGVRGTGNFKGTLRIWFKNENNIAWLDNEPVAMSPDLVCLVDRNTCQGITNTEMKIGLNVGVVGIKAPQILRTEKGVELLGPKQYGFDIQYVPLEKLSERFQP